MQYELLDSLNQVVSDILALSNGAHIARNTSKYRVPYSCNILEQYDSSEPFTSWALAMILNYRNESGFVLLKSFVSKFLRDKGFNIDDIVNPRIIAETEDRIDILIKDDKYCIIIENKLKGADFQQNQLARYIKSQESYPIDRIFIILLPRDCNDESRYAGSLRESVWKLPVDYRVNNGFRRCSLNQYKCWCDVIDRDKTEDELEHCKHCINYMNLGYCDRTVTIHSALAEWLTDECLPLVPKDECILTSFIVQFADFLKLQYKTRESEKLLKEMKEYIREHLGITSSSKVEDNLSIIEDKINDITHLLDDLKRLQEEEYGKQINEWYTILKENPDFSDKIKTDGQSFKIQIEGIWCGCWLDDESHPYWAFCKDGAEPNEKDEEIVSKILTACGMANEGKPENRYIRWANTDNGIRVCEMFYNAAYKLGLLK